MAAIPEFDDEVIDTTIRYSIRFVLAVLFGALVFTDVIVMDVHWQKAMLVGALTAGCYFGGLGIWVIRKAAIVLTVYAVGYLIGALPPIGSVGAYLTRALS